MKKQIIVGMAVILTAIFLYPSMASADHSHLWAPDDYRTKSIRDIYGAQQPKPTAQFAVSRSRNGALLDRVVSDAGNDLDLAFPVLDAYVGDELTFQDMSHGNGYSIIEWDWQWSGDIGDAVQKTPYDPLPDTRITLTEPGMTVFYLCVRSNVPVAPGIVDAWSDNGTHQTIGKNRWFPDGMYWYFTAVRVVVHPATEAQLVVRYWDAPANRLIHEGTVWPGTLLGEDAAIETSIQITDWEGYTFDRWRVVLPDGTEQYSGTEREVLVTLAGFVPIKYINVECYPIQQGVATNLTIREWDKATNQLLAEVEHPGGTVEDGKEAAVSYTISDKPGYQFTNYSIILPDGMVEQSGKERKRIPAEDYDEYYTALSDAYLGAVCVYLCRGYQKAGYDFHPFCLRRMYWAFCACYRHLRLHRYSLERDMDADADTVDMTEDICLEAAFLEALAEWSDEQQLAVRSREFGYSYADTARICGKNFAELNRLLASSHRTKGSILAA